MERLPHVYGSDDENCSSVYLESCIIIARVLKHMGTYGMKGIEFEDCLPSQG